MEARYTSREARDKLARLGRDLDGKTPDRAIVQALQDDNQAVRNHAISLAVRHLEPELLGDLVADDANAILRNAALEALERQGPYALPYLRRMAGGPNHEVAMFAALTMGHIPDPASVPILVDMLDHTDENVKLTAIEALGNHRTEQAVVKLCSMMNGSFWQQFAVIRALGQIGDSRAVPYILEALGHEMLVEPAVEALGGIASAECLEPLWNLLNLCHREPIREKVLKSVAQVLDRHSGSHLSVGRGGCGTGLAEYLERALRSADADLARAAALIVLNTRQLNLYTLIVERCSDPEERAWVHDLFHRFPGEFQRALPVMLGHPDPDVRCHAMATGPVGASSISRVMNCLQDRDPEVRAAACRALGASRAVNAIPALLERFMAAGPGEREAAVAGLSCMPPSELGSLAPCLDQTRPAEIVIAALSIVEEAKCRNLAELVVDLLAAGHIEIRRAALKAAGSLPNVDPERHILPMLQDSDQSVRLEAMEVLVRVGCRGLVDSLLPLLSREDPIRYHAIRALGRLRAEPASEPLRELFPEARPHEKIEILSALVRIAPQWIVSFLRENFEQDDGEIRRIAAEGLVRIPGALSSEDLIKMAADEDWSIRSFAALGLGRNMTQSARRALIDLSRDMEPLVAGIAREALGKYRAE